MGLSKSGRVAADLIDELIGRFSPVVPLHPPPCQGFPNNLEMRELTAERTTNNLESVIVIPERSVIPNIDFSRPEHAR